MSMETHAMNRQLTADEAFEVTLLVSAEIMKNILKDRNPQHEKRNYWLDKIDKDIEGINRTYEGYLPENFQGRAEKFYRMLEADIQFLLKGYKDHSK